MVTQVKPDMHQQKTFHFVRGYPFIGNLPAFTNDRLGILKRMAREGDVCGIHFGPFPLIQFNKPEYVHSILVEHAYDFDKGVAIHNTFRSLIGDGIFSSEGDFHRHQRKLMSPPFQPRHIATYADIMGHYGEQISQTWADGRVIDINQQMTIVTMSVIGKALFDADVFTETDELGAAMTIINEYVDEQLMAECATLFGAGHETTATALTWAWYLLCQHPESYQKVQEEVDSVLQGRTPTYADLARLPYCLQVFKEAMRLYPPAYAFSRRAIRDVEIDGYRVPKNWFVLLTPYTLHRREEYFPEPEKFQPERFTPEREKQLPRYAYLPFGAGPRICIGQYFAMMEGHLLLATLAQRVSFSLVPGQTITPDPIHHLALRPDRAVNVTVKKR